MYMYFQLKTMATISYTCTYSENMSVGTIENECEMSPLAQVNIKGTAFNN